MPSPKSSPGSKDSSGDGEHARKLGQLFGKDLLVMNGNDRLFSLRCKARRPAVSPPWRPGFASAAPGVGSGQPRRARWETPSRLNTARDMLDAFPPAATFIKEMLHHQYHFPSWGVCRPLTQLQQALAEHATQRWAQLNHV